MSSKLNSKQSQMRKQLASQLTVAKTAAKNTLNEIERDSSDLVSFIRSHVLTKTDRASKDNTVEVNEINDTKVVPLSSRIKTEGSPEANKRRYQGKLKGITFGAQAPISTELRKSLEISTFSISGKQMSLRELK